MDHPRYVGSTCRSRSRPEVKERSHRTWCGTYPDVAAATCAVSRSVPRTGRADAIQLARVQIGQLLLQLNDLVDVIERPGRATSMVGPGPLRATPRRGRPTVRRTVAARWSGRQRFPEIFGTCAAAATGLIRAIVLRSGRLFGATWSGAIRNWIAPAADLLLAVSSAARWAFATLVFKIGQGFRFGLEPQVPHFRDDAVLQRPKQEVPRSSFDDLWLGLDPL
uniref:(northern house mosquito) hypothetical protein n=1 Tax=Culex pipiens TaxID=7175 RepID=A0A8D8N1N0_CULPI